MTTTAKTGTSGTENGHVPGHSYTDATVRILPDGMISAHVVWGSCQGYDEDHGSYDYVGESIRQIIDDMKDDGCRPDAIRHVRQAHARAVTGGDQ